MGNKDDLNEAIRRLKSTPTTKDELPKDPYIINDPIDSEVLLENSSTEE